MQTMRHQIVTRIERLGAGKAFSAKDFLDIASRTTIDVTLASLTLSGKIRRIKRGLYDMPKINPALGGELSPDLDEAARAIARRQRWKIVPEGPWAANLLGLSTQVPAKIIYLTDGPNNDVAIGRRSIHFKHARPKVMAGPEGKFALVVQALRHLGKDGVWDTRSRESGGTGGLSVGNTGGLFVEPCDCALIWPQHANEAAVSSTSLAQE